MVGKNKSSANIKQALDRLRDELLSAQTALTESRSAAVALIITGIPSAGRSEVVNALLEWMDPKHIRVHAAAKLRGAVRGRPPLWPFWLRMPARGQLAIYFNGWYDDPLQEGLHPAKKSRHAQKRAIERIRQLETMLAFDGVRVVKLYMHVDRATQKQRLKELQSKKLTRWRVTDEDRWMAKHYKLVDQTMRIVVEATDAKQSRWHTVDGSDADRRLLDAGKILLAQMQAATGPVKAPATRWRSSAARPAAEIATLDDKDYDTELETLQGRFALLTRSSKFAKRGAVFAFEGMDAAGKGGAIRRLTAALDARQYSVVPVSAPSAEERAHPYLWRFWRHAPARGEIAIFDRSWYGRVLVERVREFATPGDWQRAYDEIVEFERQFVEHDIVVHKFWLSVGKDEQQQRFDARSSDPLKRFKVDPEDLKNREFFDQYQAAAADMLERTSTPDAPWTVVQADDKKQARLVILRTACEALEKALD